MSIAQTHPAQGGTAQVWIVYREGLRLVGARAGIVPFERSVARLDLAPWRFFSKDHPDEISIEELSQETRRQRVLVEVTPESVGDLGGFAPGFYESPFSPTGSLARLELPPLR